MTTPGRPKTVGVRLAGNLIQLLEEAAQKSRMSPTTLAKKLVVDGLTLAPDAVERRLSELQAGIERIERLVLELRPRTQRQTTELEAEGPTTDGTSLQDWLSDQRLEGES